MTLNRILAVLVKAQLHNHGDKPIKVLHAGDYSGDMVVVAARINPDTGQVELITK